MRRTDERRREGDNPRAGGSTEPQARAGGDRGRRIGMFVGPDWSGQPSLPVADAKGLASGEARRNLKHDRAWEQHQRDTKAWVAGRSRAIADAAARVRATAGTRGPGSVSAAARDAAIEAAKQYEKRTPRPSFNSVHSVHLNTTPRRPWRDRRCRIRGQDTRPRRFPRSRDSHQAASIQRNKPNGSRATYVSMCEIRPRPGGGRIAADGGPRPPNESVAAAPRTAHCDPASASRLLGWPPLTSTRTGDPAKPSSVNARRTPAAPSTGSGIGPIRGRRPSARRLGDSQRPPRPGRRSCK
jgi:hypothetical protein